MKQAHILETSLEELEKSNTLKEELRNSSQGLSYWFFSIFKGSFKHNFLRYIEQKNDILMHYSSLYSDIQKDISNPGVSADHNKNTQESLLYMTQSIQECGDYLEKMLPYSQRQKEILTREKGFFLDLLMSFNTDVRLWLQKHAQEISGEISDIDIIQKESTLESGKAVLELQKKRLESHINNISQI